MEMKPVSRPSDEWSRDPQSFPRRRESIVAIVTLNRCRVAAAALLLLIGSPLVGQTLPVNDSVLRRIWEVGMDDSQAMSIAQALMDSIGPRLTGTPNFDRAVDWAVSLTQSWGAASSKEQYGTWLGWERGYTHIDLIAPRERTLEGTMVGYSPGTDGPVEGPVVIVPEYESDAQMDAFVRTVSGKFVAIAFPQPTCRPDAHYTQFGTPEALERLQQERQRLVEEFRRRVPSAPLLRLRLEAAGAAGILESTWSNASTWAAKTMV
jgi:carboxypeptidase Q